MQHILQAISLQHQCKAKKNIIWNKQPDLALVRVCKTKLERSCSSVCEKQYNCLNFEKACLSSHLSEYREFALWSRGSTDGWLTIGRLVVRSPCEPKAFNKIVNGCKQLGVEAYYYVMINGPMTCLILNRLHKV